MQITWAKHAQTFFSSQSPRPVWHSQKAGHAPFVKKIEEDFKKPCQGCRIYDIFFFKSFFFFNQKGNVLLLRNPRLAEVTEQGKVCACFAPLLVCVDYMGHGYWFSNGYFQFIHLSGLVGVFISSACWNKERYWRLVFVPLFCIMLVYACKWYVRTFLY